MIRPIISPDQWLASEPSKLSKGSCSVTALGGVMGQLNEIGQRTSRRGAVEQDAVPFEVRREACQDENGNRYTVIVWQHGVVAPWTSYTLADGSPVHYEDECWFDVPGTGKMLTRCKD